VNWISSSLDAKEFVNCTSKFSRLALARSVLIESPKRPSFDLSAKASSDLGMPGSFDPVKFVNGIRLGRNRIVGLGVALSALVYQTWPTLEIPFGIIDDHEIVEIVGRNKHLSFGKIPGEVSRRWDEPFGRFRPFYWVGRVFESAIAGGNPFYWHLNRLFLASIVLVAVYSIAIRFVPMPSAVAVSLLPFVGSQVEVWRRLGPNETYAVPLACVGCALLVASRVNRKSVRYQWPAFLLLTLAGLSKENFLLVSIVLVAFSVWIHGLEKMEALDWLVAGSVGVLWLASVVPLIAKIKKHGSIYPQTHNLHSVLVWIRYVTFEQVHRQGLILGAIVLVLGAVLGWRSGDRKTLFLCAVLVFAVALPQVAFYTGAQQEGRYLYPLSFLPSLVWGVGSIFVARLSKEKSGGRVSAGKMRVIGTFAVPLLLLAPVSLGILTARAQGYASVKKNEAFQETLGRILLEAQRVQADSIVFQPADPWSDIEATLSLSRFLAARTDLRVMTMPASSPVTGPAAGLSKQIESWSKNGTSSLTPYVPSKRCVSIVFGANRPVCSTTVTRPGV
jgi:hypothetical protein